MLPLPHSESYIEKACVRFAKRAGWFCRKVRWLGRDNAPDRYFARNGKQIWIEFKKTKGKATIAQKREHRKMRAAGVKVYVVNSIRRGREILA